MFIIYVFKSEYCIRKKEIFLGYVLLSYKKKYFNFECNLLLFIIGCIIGKLNV